MKTGKVLSSMIVTIAVLAGPTIAQISHIGVRPLASNVIIPQSRAHAFAPDNHNAIEITDVSVLIDILESTATTTIEIHLQNTTNQRQEAELIVPVPDGAVVKGFAYDGPNGGITAQVLPKDKAKSIYEGLVSKMKDPALVEFIGYNLIQSSVFPVEPHGKQKIRLTYEHLLEVDGNRIDYILPRTESLEYAVPWDIIANITSKRPISTVYSASHELEMKRVNDKHIKVNLTTDAVKQPGSFRLSYLLEGDGVTASMFTYPDKKVGGGYFLLFAGLPADSINTKDAPAIKREVTIVIDRSGSMRNEKIKQVKEAALQIISGLKKGEAFNVIIYSNTVEWFAKSPVIKTKETAAAASKYIEGITATGGTDIHSALVAALSQKPTEDMLPIVLFLTDGLPTVGQTSEIDIRNVVIKSNPYQRRVFTFGVGVDLNAPLLDKIAAESRAKSDFVLPGEDVEVKIGNVFKRLIGPILASPELEIVDKNGKPALGRTRDILPNKLPDLFEGDQLVLLGQYVGDKPITFKLNGNYLGKKRTFKFAFDFNKANVKNGFVPRLWASRKIAEMVDEIRNIGADKSVSANDPRVKELISEIVNLSTEFGILTEYTAFLAKDGTDLNDQISVIHEATDNFSHRAMRSRSGLEGVNQSYNGIRQIEQKSMNYHNTFYDTRMDRVSVANVQQINDRAYYRKGNRWVDSRLVNSKKDIEPNKTIQFGSKEFIELAQKLAADNRQGGIALKGDILLQVDGETILIESGE